ncbi:MAG: hypothetical protein HOF03_04320 [Candidatus Marinimicrobia bacterium]|jgi:hypothetical protein|nr:hypothetical protein [Candidatus Neomarinimicrobiota bacterium]MBT3839609.1 hypothetical protein [Candidatus Neomarinimicrobiota bacterium]MBT3999136.1 hypothetical protein [Candidatus Neomarinimicrobiota bacterium]MBT4635598.1 hypothetical protein [Candidatus Neomarinimicrobiota bacterium]MBT7114462.1 hypothetical protein [Candidatus Neomarinimicrobiota bacterium]
MNRAHQIFLAIFFILIFPDIAKACSTCYGDPNASASQGMNWAIISLLGVTGGVLGGIISAIISIANKTKNFQQTNKL